MKEILEKWIKFDGECPFGERPPEKMFAY